VNAKNLAHLARGQENALRAIMNVERIENARVLIVILHQTPFPTYFITTLTVLLLDRIASPECYQAVAPFRHGWVANELNNSREDIREEILNR
jgi:hypothetical protein